MRKKGKTMDEIPTIHIDATKLPSDVNHGYFIVNFETGKTEQFIHAGEKKDCTDAICVRDMEEE